MAFPVSASASERSNHKLSINIDKNPTLNGLFGLGNYAFAPNSQLFEPRMHCRGRLGGLYNAFSARRAVNWVQTHNFLGQTSH